MNRFGRICSTCENEWLELGLYPCSACDNGSKYEPGLAVKSKSLEQENAALRRDLILVCKSVTSPCEVCRHGNNEHCRKCHASLTYPGWEWRGVES